MLYFKKFLGFGKHADGADLQSVPVFYKDKLTPFLNRFPVQHNYVQN
jgi:hypothetical protein